MDTFNGERQSIPRIILVPAVITLAITLLRLTGELQQWPTSLFSPAAGGGGAIVGITWLVPVFGIYFAVRLAKLGERPKNTALAIVLAVAGFILLFLGSVVAFGGEVKSLRRYGLGLLIMAAAGAIQYFAWPVLFKVLIAYAYAARIPVAIVMFFAIRGNWGTHYDVAGPGVPDMPFVTKFIVIGLLPQLIFWVAFTVVVGLLLGAPTVAIFRNWIRRRGIADAPTLSST